MNTEKEVKTSEVVSVMVGRVRFEGIIKETKVINLICEECENDFAVLKCMQCDQVISSPLLSLSPRATILIFIPQSKLYLLNYSTYLSLEPNHTRSSAADAARCVICRLYRTKASIHTSGLGSISDDPQGWAFEKCGMAMCPG